MVALQRCGLDASRWLPWFEAWYDGADATQSYARFLEQLKAEGGVVHVLAEDKLLRGDFITTIRSVEPSTTMLKTKLGFKFLETEQATEGSVIVGAGARGGSP